MQTLETPSVNGHAKRLNIGGGDTYLKGFVNIDRKNGQEAYPLAQEDGSVDEILASHVLEHFSHRQTSEVLQHWVQKLAPGGRIRIAVPDFEKVAQQYLDGAAINVQGYVMGGHVDSDDHHGCIFDRESLTELMTLCGLERIGSWQSSDPNCASLEISLNLQGFKPSSAIKQVKGIRACISTPRFGPLMHPRCYQRAFQQLGIEATSTCSCFWHQALSNLIEDDLAKADCEYVLTMDFDTIFCAADVLELYRLLVARPDVDAIFPLQSKRGCEDVLCSMPKQVTTGDLTCHLLEANTGHFGLTLFRAESLRKFPKPWMVPEPNSKGSWRDGQRDADIDFWRRFKAAGFKYCLAPRIVVGHLEEVVKWPGKDLRPFYQAPGDYDENGIPAEVVR